MADTPKKKTKAQTSDKRAAVWPVQTSEQKQAEAAELKKTGRPTDCTPALIQKMQVLIRNGNYIETAAACCDISKQTLFNWLKRGNKGEEPFKTFLDSVNRASAEAEALDLAVITQAANEGKQWGAAAWKLERRNSTRWGRKFEASIQGVPGGAPIKMRNEVRKSLDRLSSDELKMLKTLNAKMVSDEAEEGEEAFNETTE
jgi:hypothetical protein